MYLHEMSIMLYSSRPRFTCLKFILHTITVNYNNIIMLTNTSMIMKVIVWIFNDIHMEFNDIHWEGCLHVRRVSIIIN